MIAHKKVYLVYVDILGFENLAEDIANNRMPAERVRTSFVNTINEELKSCCLEGLLIGKSFGRDDWILAIDNKQKVLSVLSRMINLDIPIEIGIGIKLFDKLAKLEGKKLVNYKETIEFIKSDIIGDYHKWYKYNNNESIQETFIVITDSFFNELPIGDQNRCDQILFKNRHFYYLPKSIIARERKINDFLYKIKHERSDFSGALIDRVFIPPDGYEEIKKTLERDRIVFISGTAGYGKTYTTLKLLWEYFNKDYTPKWISGKDGLERRNVRDKLAYIESQLESNHILYFEDPFGKAEYERRDDLKERIWHIINTVKNKENVFVIITSRKDVFEEFEKETYSVEEIKKFEQELNILQPAYDTKKRLNILTSWAAEKGCNWLKIEELKNFVCKSIENKEILPTPLSIYDFVEATIHITNKRVLKEKLYKYSGSTGKAFADEIIGLYNIGRKDRVTLLSLISISERFEIDLIKKEYEEYKDDDFDDFESILAEEYRIKERLFKDEKYLEFSHISYLESIPYVLKNPGCKKIFWDISKILLNHELRHVQWGTAEALGNIGDLNAVPQLIETLNDPHENVRRAAAWALGNIGNSKAVPQLILALNDSDFAVRRTAIQSLGKIGNPIAVPFLIENLEGIDFSAQKASAEALGRIKDKEAVLPLIKNLNNPDWHIQIKSIEALGKIGDSQAVSPLIQLLENSFGNIRYEIILALGRIGKPAVKPLIKVLNNEISSYDLNDPNWIDKSGTTEALIKIRKSVLQYVIEYLEDPDPEIRQAAIHILRIIGDPDAVKTLIEIILNDQELVIRKDAVRALGEIKDPIIIKPLIKILDTADSVIKLQILDALGRINDPQTIDTLIKMLKDPNPRIREKTAEILGKMKNSRVIEPLQELILYEKNWSSIIPTATSAINKIGNQKSVQFFIKRLRDPYLNVKKRSVEALGELGDLSAVQPLIDELNCYDEDLLLNIIQALGKLGDKKAVQPLIDELNYYDEDVLLNVIRVLGELGDKKAVQPLIETLKYDDQYVQEQAIVSLVTIGDINAVKPIIKIVNNDPEYEYGAIWKTLKKINGSKLVDNIVEAFDFDEDKIENSYSISNYDY